MSHFPTHQFFSPSLLGSVPRSFNNWSPTQAVLGMADNRILQMWPIHLNLYQSFVWLEDSKSSSEALVLNEFNLVIESIRNLLQLGLLRRLLLYEW